MVFGQDDMLILNSTPPILLLYNLKVFGKLMLILEAEPFNCLWIVEIDVSSSKLLPSSKTDLLSHHSIKATFLQNLHWKSTHFHVFLHLGHVFPITSSSPRPYSSSSCNFWFSAGMLKNYQAIYWYFLRVDKGFSKTLTPKLSSVLSFLPWCNSKWYI